MNDKTEMDIMLALYWSGGSLSLAQIAGLVEMEQKDVSKALDLLRKNATISEVDGLYSPRIEKSQYATLLANEHAETFYGGNTILFLRELQRMQGRKGVKRAMPEDKQQRLFLAGMECFAKNGYHKAAVDEIVAKAGISKSLLFHYYSNKKAFYIALLGYAFALVQDEVERELNNKERDLFAKLRQTEAVKIRFFTNYPHIQKFIASTYEETDDSLVEEIRALRQEMPTWENDYLDGVDVSKLRVNVDLRQLLQMIRWIGAGIVEQHKHNMNLETMSAEMNGYLDALKQGFYKEEYL